MLKSVPLNMFMPSSILFPERSKAELLLWILFMSPVKSGRHIEIMSPSSSPALSHFWFLIETFEGMHHFHLKFTEG